LPGQFRGGYSGANLADTINKFMGAHSEAIIILAATARDAQLAAQTLQLSGLHSHICRDSATLQAKLNSGAGAVLMSEEALDLARLEILEHFFEVQPPWSDLPIVFLQRPSAELQSPGLQRLALNGNLSILERPLHQSTLISAIETALRARRRQYQVRDLLDEKEADVRRRDEFLAMLGHELRNPLAAIRYAIGLLDELDESSETRTPRAVIGRQTTHLARLVDDLLDVARVTRGKITIDKEPVELNELAKKTIDGLEVARRDAGHDVRFLPAPEPLWVEGDAVRIEQIFSNLLFNAVKYTPPGGQISLSTRRDGAEAVVCFEDNGIGISAELLARVFDLFSQSQSSIDRSRGGLGIGLTLVRGLVELHGGRVAATSEGPGKGSCFEVRFPLLSREEVEAEPQNAEGNSDARRVLIIEDNEDAREVMSLLLRLSGHSVDCASDGQEGLEKMLALRPDIALVDIGLPLLDGYEIAARVRSQSDCATFLVALTGYGQPEDRRRALAAGFDEHLTKPIETARLYELIESVKRSD
jgi:signal transduction histidine kinase/ActR/RegA family two-component response regulator